MILDGKHIAVLGVADSESLAWAIARECSRQGARVTVGYQQKFLSRVRLLLETEPAISGRRCDVLDEDELGAFFAPFEDTGLHGLVHSIAYGPAAAFTSEPSAVSAGDFAETLDLSAHSLARVVRHAKPALRPGASVVTLSFQASLRAMPMYGMMGVAKAALESLVRYLAVELGRQGARCNAVSAGPVETLAALSEIVAFQRDPEALGRLPGRLVQEALAAEALATPGQADDPLEAARRCWRRIQEGFAERSALPEIVSAEDVASSVAFLLGDGSRRITGQVLHVDSGFSACQLV